MPKLTLTLCCAAAISLGCLAQFPVFAADSAPEKKVEAKPAKPAPPENKAKPTTDVDKDPPEAAKLVDGKPVGEGWAPLFNGKDMSGWKFQPEFWKVEDGVMHGFTPGGKEHHFAYTERQDYGDFEIHADVKLIGYNSGVCIRIAPTSFDNVPGYQVDMGDGYWGSLWDDRGAGMVAGYPKAMADKILHKNDWNHYYARAVGHHIEMWLNGVKTVDVIDEKGKLTGPIGFQLCHGGSSTDASFKNLYVREIKK